MILATSADMRASFGVEEVANLTRLYMEACISGDAPGEDIVHFRSEDGVLSWAIARASGRAVSYVGTRYPVLARFGGPDGFTVPPALVGAVCDMARFFLTGTAIQETDPIAERYKDAVAWLKEIAAGAADLPGLGDAGEDGELVTGSVAFVSHDRQWSTTS